MIITVTPLKTDIPSDGHLSKMDTLTCPGSVPAVHRSVRYKITSIWQTSVRRTSVRRTLLCFVEQFLLKIILKTNTSNFEDGFFTNGFNFCLFIEWFRVKWWKLLFSWLQLTIRSLLCSRKPFSCLLEPKNLALLIWYHCIQEFL